MGLDITAYSNLEAVGQHVEPGKWCENEDHIKAYAYDSFPQSFAGIPILSTSDVGNDTTFIEGGCYRITDKTETFEFRAGSYRGYGQWRADLRDQFNPDTEPDKPFYELIWFADNEGTIGPQAASELLQDFRDYAAQYIPPGIDPDYSRSKYDDWYRACFLAKSNGLIRFW